MDLETYLRKAPLTDAQRADLWDAYEGSEDEDALAQALEAVQVSTSVKAGLWDMKADRMFDSQPGDGGGPSVPSVPEVGTEPPRRLLGGKTTISAGEPEGLLSRGYGAVKEAIFGDPDREEAAAAGIGLHPTAADLGRAAVGLGATGMVGGGLLRGATMLPGVVGRAAGPVMRAAASPGGAAAAAGVGSLASGSGVTDAISNAALTALGAKGLPAAARAARAMTRGVRAPARAAAGAAKAASRARPSVTPSAPKKPPQRAPETPKAAAAADKKAAPVVSRGAAVAQRHNELMAFGKKIAAENPKVGEKIWILLDDAGRPVKMLTPDQAGAAARKGLQTTWVKNLWESSR